MWRSIVRTGGVDVSSSLNGAGGLAQLEALPVDSLHEREACIDGEVESLILYRDAVGNVRGWLNICPHAGRRLDWSPGQFLRSKQGELVCAVHGATFALPQGVCVAGPCRGESLRKVALLCENGEIRLAATAQ
jgi:nitrite reductase/ring-hydroxylating ferredoxin subunit